MKIGCSSWSFHKAIAEGKLNQESWLRKCAEELGLDGVELLDAHFPTVERWYLKRIKKLCTDLGLTISFLSVSNDFTQKDYKTLQEQVDRVMEWVDMTLFMGTPILRLFAGSGEAARDETIWNNMISAMCEVTDYAESQGVILALENHGGFECDEVLRILDEVGSDWLRLTLDTGNFPTEPYKSIERAAPFAATVHAKFYEFDSQGREVRLDYERIIEILDKANFRGYLSIEYEGEGDELEEVPKACAYLKRLLGRNE